MDRTPRRRLLGLAVVGGVVVAVAVPQLVGADPAPSVWPVDLHPTVVDRASAPLEPPDPAATIAPAPAPAPAPVVEPAGTRTPEPPEEVPTVTEDSEAETPEPAVSPAPAAPVEGPATAGVGMGPPAEVAPAGGVLTVHVVPVDGADRFVTVQPVDGGTGVGPLTVGGDAIVLDLPAGTYDLLVEQVAHGGGAFVTRARFTMDSGGQVAASCDPDTLECAVVA